MPSWCDRVLYGGRGTRTIKDYNSVTDLKMSDHKPIYARIEFA